MFTQFFTRLFVLQRNYRGIGVGSVLSVLAILTFLVLVACFLLLYQNHQLIGLRSAMVWRIGPQVAIMWRSGPLTLLSNSLSHIAMSWHYSSFSAMFWRPGPQVAIMWRFGLQPIYGWHF